MQKSTATWNGTAIVTAFVFPPIPNRNFDWSAYLDGNEESGPYGQGASEHIAIADLVQQLAEAI